jgi:uncharacterized 2Fe-2S/4Fe-4S cluster protein (DUF4445 family)
VAMDSYQVKFLPSETTIEVEPGTDVMQAAENAGVHINNLCGGKGICGKCRVKIAGGQIRADSNSISLLSKEEIAEGYVLACRMKIDSDMEILIPPESRLDEAQILLDAMPVDYSEPEMMDLRRESAGLMGAHEPLVEKIYLEVTAPTLQDNVSDIDRIVRELRRRTAYRNFEISLHCLRDLALKLRDNDWKVTTSLAKHGDISRILDIEAGDATDCNYGLAVDVGTTTVVAQLINLKSGKILGVAGTGNLQAGYGEDVISRMIYACSKEGGLDPLHKAVVTNINQLTRALCKENGVDSEEITCVAAAGNTTMSHLLLSLIPCSIRLDPYVPTVTVYPQIRARDVGINIHPEGILEVVPGVASYVGGDIVAGILACGIADRPEIGALMDVGTNGEIAIGNNEWMVCCSASAGPAFEGAGIKHGIRAVRGAIEKVTMPNGRVKYNTVGQAKAKGICGSGLIDCLHELARNQFIDHEGKYRLVGDRGGVVDKDGERHFVLAYGDETETGHDLVITESDISHLIRSKAAVFAAMKSLLNYVGLTCEDITHLYVAGGFGSYLDIQKAIGIGLLPDIDPQKICFIGNSSLTGARMCLLSVDTMERAVRIARSTTNIELSNYHPFMDEYVAAMFLPHTDKRLFPSVEY